jgi:RNA polymerase sigma factor (sigma-70 family)
MVSDEFGELVTLHYEALYKFAFSLTRDEAGASDLTQQTFHIWATKGHQLRDRSKVKILLFTTLHLIFLEALRRQARFPHRGLDKVVLEDLPAFPPSNGHMDSVQLLKALAKVDEAYQGAVALFYLENYSCREMADILDVPEETVRLRLSRGIAQLRHLTR